MPGDLASAIDLERTALDGFGSPLFYFATIGSTNDEAARLAMRGAAEGTTVVADAQTAGRGRQGRAWFSPPEAGLYLSVILRPNRESTIASGDPSADPSRLTPPLPSRITLLSGVALCEAVLETTGLSAHIKWPNDLVCGQRKFAGILAEAGTSDDDTGFVVVGIGINVRRVDYPRDVAVRATSIEEELGRSVDRGTLLARTLSKLSACRSALRNGRADEVMRRYQALAPDTVGQPIEWRTADGTRRGTTAGIAADGALLARAGDRLERIVAGEITWIRERGRLPR